MDNDHGSSQATGVKVVFPDGCVHILLCKYLKPLIAKNDFCISGEVTHKTELSKIPLLHNPDTKEEHPTELRSHSE